MADDGSPARGLTLRSLVVLLVAVFLQAAWISYAERYDRSGRLWRILDQFFFIGRGYGGAELGQYTAIQSIDIEKVHATILKSDMKFGLDYPLTLFNKDYLQKNGY